ncbi:hypothetical protein TrispH2_006368 [Trichoplax sp. H2]|nr:hypothetical protein TrispH2_006368 [Trichoplax sp. H2]|eukprot:RDD41821.1 hypothetical protein TrispH2_006368 [Trichoplax sp. H2]
MAESEEETLQRFLASLSKEGLWGLLKVEIEI